jgi:kynureninase
VTVRSAVALARREGHLALDIARRLDAADPLRGFRKRFHLPDGVVYLTGNSLGALPKATVNRLHRAIRAEWGQDLIDSWNKHDWISAPARVGAKIASLIGAEPDEVIVSDSTSMNLFKLLLGALAMRPGRRVVLTEPGNFPTNLYIADGLQRLGLCEVRLAKAPALVDAIDDDVAVVLLTHVHYQSAAAHDMAAFTEAAHSRGALALWDLSHSVGALAVDLNVCGADLAVGCGYKYLNGGPGAPAFQFVGRRHQGEFRSPITGWMGHAAPFAFDDEYVPAAGVRQALCGTPPVLALAALETGVDLVREIGIDGLATKGRALTSFFLQCVSDLEAWSGLSVVSPVDALRRGSHVALRHPDAFAICQALSAYGIVGDFRAPDVLRLGFAPAYIGFEDSWRAAAALRSVLREQRWKEPRFNEKRTVT